MRIHSATVFEFAGKLFQLGAETMAPQHPGFAGGQCGQLQSVLYSYAYAKPFRGTLPAEPTAQAYDDRFTQSLRNANQSEARWDHGWQVYSTQTDGTVYAKKGDRQRSAIPGEFLAAQPGSPVQTGETIQIYMPREATTLQPGFYHVFGETPSDMWDNFSLVRFYFHISAAGAAPLIRFLSATLNRYLIPFQFKTVAQPWMYDRTDAAVLYTARRYFTLLRTLLETLPQEVTGELGAEAPRFSLPVRPGVGSAEDPGNGESFGMQRCRLLAEGLIEAFQRGLVAVEDRLSAVETHFTRNGLDPERPHLARKGGDFPVVPAEVVFADA